MNQSGLFLSQVDCLPCNLTDLSKNFCSIREARFWHLTDLQALNLVKPQLSACLSALVTCLPILSHLRSWALNCFRVTMSYNYRSFI